MSGALLGFVFLGLFSPGPNVILLTASGARFGFRRTLPHLAGVVLGVGIIAGITGLGIGALLLARPGLTLALKIGAALWILVMARRLWLSAPGQGRNSARPMTLIEAVLFQGVNPKVWAVALAATAFVAPLAPLGKAATLGLTFSGMNLFVCLFWSAAGALLSTLLSDPARWQILARGMAVLLALFAGLVFL